MGGQIPWPYTIYFVNESNATAYASLITITNVLDPSLDLRTFRVNQVVLGDITISVPTNRSFLQIRVPAPSPNPTNVVVDVSVGVDVANNDIFCLFNAVDLNTGQSVTAANAGVLPPNTTNNIGQGYVVYSILPKAGVTTGTVVTNQASIVFAPNAPISTDTTTNTVDAVPPASRMGTLASAQVATNFVVSWSGADDQNGSGVGSYDIYFNDNDGPWQILELGATTNSTTFAGVPGHAYGFYSLAHDNSGNIEQKAPLVEASTFVSSNTPPVLPPIANQTVDVGNAAAVLNVAANPGGGAQVTYSLLNAPLGVTINPTNGTIYWTPLPSQAGTTNLVTVQVANNGIPPLSSSESFLATVGDYAALALGSGGVSTGQTICVPLTLVSSANLTNLLFILAYPTNRVGGLTLSPTLSQIASLQTVPLDAAHAQVTLQTVSGTSLVGTQQVASVCLTALTNQNSGIATILVNFSNASELDGTTPATLAASPGTIVVVAGHPFLTVVPAQGQVQLTLYGTSGSNYILQSSSSLSGPWTTVNTFNLSGNSQSVLLNDQTPNVMFYRMQQQ